MSGDTQISSGSYSRLLIGSVLNDLYKVDSLIGSGGLGEVFKGHAIDTGDEVAIKTIRPDLASDERVLALFRREASVLRSLNHEAIVRYFVFSAGKPNGVPYFAMEYVAGLHLHDLIRRGPLSVEQFQVLQRRLASGLQVAHEAGIIHRDISPDNIILPDGKFERAKIIDFGIARSNNAEGTLIGDSFAGKLKYTSPEQLGLFGARVTARSDIYSLGLVLAEAALGRSLEMGGDHVQLIEKRRRVPDLSGVDTRIRPLLERMLQPEPKDRFESMAEVAAWTPPAPRSRANSGPRRWIIPLLGAGALATSIAAGFVILPNVLEQGRELTRGTSREPSSVLATTPGPSTAPGAPVEADQGYRSPASTAELFETALLERLRALLPAFSSSALAARVTGYIQAREHKAQAISYTPFGTWRTTDRETREAAAEKALEGCQVYHGAPCALIATNDDLEVLPPGGSRPPRRDMPRALYLGQFDPERIPAAWAASRQPSNVLAYRSQPGPKAAAFHPWGRVFTVTGAEDQRVAEERALAACKDDPARKGADGPCYLYAVGDQVVLPRRATEPLTIAGASPDNLEDRLVAWFAAANPELSVLEQQRRAREYLNLTSHKAQAVVPGTRTTWYVYNRVSAAVAEEKDLEGCQAFAGQPCVLVAVDDNVLPLPANGSWARRDMRRTKYSGSFNLDQVPAVLDSVRRRPDVANYTTAPEPKAAAYHPWGRLFVATGARNLGEAEEQALRDCNADPERKGANGPCFVYARSNQVVLPDRRTQPSYGQP